MIDQLIGEFYFDHQALKNKLQDGLCFSIPSYVFLTEKDFINHIGMALSRLFTHGDYNEIKYQGKALSVDEIISMVETYKYEIGEKILTDWKMFGWNRHEPNLLILFENYWRRGIK